MWFYCKSCFIIVTGPITCTCTTAFTYVYQYIYKYMLYSTGGCVPVKTTHHYTLHDTKALPHNVALVFAVTTVVFNRPYIETGHHLTLGLIESLLPLQPRRPHPSTLDPHTYVYYRFRECFLASNCRSCETCFRNGILGNNS